MASPGDVDPGFGFAGKVVSSLQAPSETLAVAVQSDGKLISAGNVQNPRRFLISRHNADGSADNSFGAAGSVITQFAEGGASANAVAIQNDGKIIAAGYAGDMAAIARYNSDGTPDASFGSGGIVVARFEAAGPATVSLVSSIAIQSDGKILVCGDSFALNPLAPDYAISSNLALARFNRDGSPDETFGAGGVVIADFGGFDRGRALALQSDGKIIVAGDSSSSGTGPYTLVLARYNLDGSVDPTFGAGGAAVPIAGSLQISAVAIEDNDKVVLAGTYNSASPMNSDFALARYNKEGSLDATFGTGGLSVTDFSWLQSESRNNGAFALALQPDGKIVLGGYSADMFALARYSNAGLLDETFGTGGIVIAAIDAVGADTIAFAVAGSTSSFGLFSYVIISTLPPAPPGGVSVDALRAAQAFALAVQADGKIVAGGAANNHAVLARFHGRATPKLAVATMGATILHGDFILVQSPTGFTSSIYVGNIPQTGVGGIVSRDAAISCGSRCAASYDSGAVVTLNAVWPAGSYFTGWEGCVPDSGGGCNLTMDRDLTVIAHFEPDLPLMTDNSTLSDGEVGLGYAEQSAVVGGRLPIHAVLVSGKLPQGLSFSDRAIAGVPAKPGRFKFTVDFTDVLDRRVRKTFDVTILKPLKISTKALPAGRQGGAYRSLIKAGGGKAPYSWSVASGALPTGFILDEATGAIAGFSSAPGSFAFTVRVTDFLGQHIDKSLTLTIR